MGLRRLLALSLASLFLLAGCRADSPSGASIGLCLPPIGEGWSGQLLHYAKEAADGWEGTVHSVPTPQMPGSLMESAQKLIELKVDIAVMYAYDPAEGAKAAAALADAKIPLVLVGRGIDSSDYALLVTADFGAIGEAAGELIAQRLGGEGEVLVLDGPPGREADLCDQGFAKALERYPDMQILSNSACGGVREVAKAEVKLTLEKGIEPDAIFAQGDDMTLGAIEALQQVYAETAAVVGIGGGKETIGMLAKNHRYLKAVYLHLPSIAADAVRAAIDALAGQAFPEDKLMLLPVERIDQTNALERYDEGAAY